MGELNLLQALDFIGKGLQQRRAAKLAAQPGFYDPALLDQSLTQARGNPVAMGLLDAAQRLRAEQLANQKTKLDVAPENYLGAKPQFEGQQKTTERGQTLNALGSSMAYSMPGEYPNRQAYFDQLLGVPPGPVTGGPPMVDYGALNNPVDTSTPGWFARAGAGVGSAAKAAGHAASNAATETAAGANKAGQYMAGQSGIPGADQKYSKLPLPVKVGASAAGLANMTEKGVKNIWGTLFGEGGQAPTPTYGYQGPMVSTSDLTQAMQAPPPAQPNFSTEPQHIAPEAGPAQGKPAIDPAVLQLLMRLMQQQGPQYMTPAAPAAGSRGGSR